jgi:hypothetical protein
MLFFRKCFFRTLKFALLTIAHNSHYIVTQPFNLTLKGISSRGRIIKKYDKSPFSNSQNVTSAQTDKTC